MKNDAQCLPCRTNSRAEKPNVLETAENEAGHNKEKSFNSLIKYRKIRTLLDWIGFTLPIEFWTLEMALEYFEYFFDISAGEWQEGRKNYLKRYEESLVYENINIYYFDRKEQGIHIDITGQGCRYLELQMSKKDPQRFNWYNFLNDMTNGSANFTRVDVAMDDLEGILNIYSMFISLMSGHCVSKFHSWHPDGNFNFKGEAPTGLSLYFGSKESRLQMLIYEKGKQLELDTIWNRVEMRFKKERANEIVDRLLEVNKDADKQYISIGVLVAGILKEYLSFKIPGNDKKRHRWQDAPWWAEFLEGIEPKKLASSLPDRNVQSIHKWLEGQVSKSLAILYFAYQDIDNDWLRGLVEKGMGRLNNKDRQIVEEFRRYHSPEKKIAGYTDEKKYEYRQ